MIQVLHKVWQQTLLFTFLFLLFFSGKEAEAPKLPAALQQFYQSCNASAMAYKSNDFQHSLKLLLLAEKQWKPTWITVESKICYYLKLKNFEEAKNCMAYSVAHYNSRVGKFYGSDFQGNAFYPVDKNNPIFIELKQEEKKLHEKFLTPNRKFLMHKAREAFFYFAKIDKRFASYILEIDSMDSIGYEAVYRQQMPEQVFKNCVEPALQILIEKTGFPDDEDIGDLTLFVDIIFSNHALANKLEIMNAGLRSGKLIPDRYARIYDRSIRENYYGTQRTRTKSREWLLAPIPEIAGVDKRRAGIGLAPIYEDQVGSDYLLSDEYKVLVGK